MNKLYFSYNTKYELPYSRIKEADEFDVYHLMMKGIESTYNDVCDMIDCGYCFLDRVYIKKADDGSSVVIDAYYISDIPPIKEGATHVDISSKQAFERAMNSKDGKRVIREFVENGGFTEDVTTYICV
jgi:hypothetical protein